MRFLPIDVELMRSLFEYRPEVGGSCLVWKVNISGHQGGMRVLAGTVAGSRTIKGYWNVIVRGKSYKAHRLVWAIVMGEDPQCQVDHVLGHLVGNHIENLRLATNNNADNQQNRKPNKNNTSGYPGVSFHKRIRKWQGQIRYENRTICLGYFDTPEEAHDAYVKAKKDLHTFNPVVRRDNNE